MKIIGLAGYAQAGKSTAAEALVVRGYREMSLAYGVRLLAERINPILFDGLLGEWREYVDILDNEGYEYAKQWANIRPVLVGIGDGARSIIGEDVWIRALLKRIELVRPEFVVIPDVRYQNEVEAIQTLGGRVWRVYRPGVGPGNETEEESFREIRPDGAVTNYSGAVEDFRAEVIKYLPPGWDPMLQNDEE